MDKKVLYKVMVSSLKKIIEYMKFLSYFSFCFEDGIPYLLLYFSLLVL